MDRGYTVRLANNPAEVESAQRLRFMVFNIELGEGLPESFADGRDADAFDSVCDHLLVTDDCTRTVVGTYRLQTGTMAKANLGYYSASEFEFAPFEPIRGELIEVGRACVARAHRNLTVLGLLWKGIAEYAKKHGARYICGCSSLSSLDPAVGASAYWQLCQRHLVEPRFQTRPLPGLECPINTVSALPAKLPKLLCAYISLGARICGPPALDVVFRTTDFLTLLDLEDLTPAVRSRFLGE